MQGYAFGRGRGARTRRLPVVGGANLETRLSWVPVISTSSAVLPFVICEASPARHDTPCGAWQPGSLKLTMYVQSKV